MSRTMYARIRGRGYSERTALNREGCTGVDDYFGRVPVSYFQRWTQVSEFQLKLAFEADGLGRVLLRGCDAHGVERTVSG